MMSHFHLSVHPVNIHRMSVEGKAVPGNRKRVVNKTTWALVL